MKEFDFLFSQNLSLGRYVMKDWPQKLFFFVGTKQLDVNIHFCQESKLISAVRWANYITLPKKRGKKKLELQPFCQLTKTLMVLFLIEQIQIVSFSD